MRCIYASSVRLILLVFRVFFILAGSGVLNFDSFCAVAIHFLESEDDEALQKELKEAFRLYDKEGNDMQKILVNSLKRTN